MNLIVEKEAAEKNYTDKNEDTMTEKKNRHTHISELLHASNQTKNIKKSRTITRIRQHGGSETNKTRSNKKAKAVSS